MNSFTISVGSELAAEDMQVVAEVQAPTALTDSELNALAGSLAAIFNAKYSVTDSEVLSIVRADTVNVTVT